MFLLSFAIAALKQLRIEKEISKGSIHSVRAALMRPVQEEKYCGVYSCDASSMTIAIPLECIGLRLDGDDLLMKRGVDGVKVYLPEDFSSHPKKIKYS